MLWGVTLARIRYAQLIPPAAHSLVLSGSTKALGVLTVIQVESNRDSGPPRYSLKALKMDLNFCSQSWQLKGVGGIAQNISRANINIGTLGNSYFVS